MIHWVAARERCDGVRLRREPAGRHRRERVRERLVRRHRVVDAEPARATRAGARGAPSARCRGPRAAAPSGGSGPGGARPPGPGSSDSIIWRPPTLSRGSTATARMMIPMPPSHWVNWRHIESERRELVVVRHDARARRRRRRTSPRGRRRSDGRAARRRRRGTEATRTRRSGAAWPTRRRTPRARRPAARRPPSGAPARSRARS